MWIQTTNTDSAGDPVTRRLVHPQLDEPIEFSANGKAQVTKSVGEQATELYETVEPVEGSDTADDSGDAGAEGGDATDETADE